MDISFFKNRFDSIATVKKMGFSEFSKFFEKPKKDDIDTKTYKGLSPDEQMKYKDCGGFVCGIFKNNKRSAKNLLERNALAIDVDHLERDFIGDAFDNIINLFRHLKLNTIIRL